MLLTWHLPLASARRWFQTLRDGAYAVEGRLLKVVILEAELAVSCSQLRSDASRVIVLRGEKMLALDVIHRLEAVDRVLALRLCLVLEIDHAKRGCAGVSRTTQRHCHSCLQVYFRLAVVVELVAMLLRKLKRQLRNAVSVGVVEDAYWLLGDRIAVRLFEPLGPSIRRWTVGRSIRAVLLATQHLGLLLWHERAA